MKLLLVMHAYILELFMCVARALLKEGFCGETVLLGYGFVELRGVYLAVAAGRCQGTFWGCVEHILFSARCWNSCSKAITL